MLGVSSAALPKGTGNAAVVPAAVLGSRTAEMTATHSLIIRGSRASALAKVLRQSFVP